MDEKRGYEGIVGGLSVRIIGSGSDFLGLGVWGLGFWNQGLGATVHWRS